MKDTVISIVLIVAVLVGLPVLILWMRDRGGVMGTTIKRTLGALSLLFGIAMVGWFIFNLFHPTEAFRWHFYRVFQLAIPAVMIWFGAAWLFGSGPGLENEDIDFDSPELLAATEQARDTLPYFIGRVSQHIDNAFVKFPFQTDQGVTEHIWGYVHHHEDGIFNVSLANTPYTQKGEYETRLDVPESDVEDWQIVLPDGTIKGAYSLIGAFRFLENRGRKLSRKMLKQKSHLVDAEPGAEVATVNRTR